MYERSTEIRKLSASDVRKLSDILDLSNDWKLLMGHIPKDVTVSSEDCQPKYTTEQIRTIENFSAMQRRSPTEILIDEWGTSGKKRPTIEVLLNVLVKAQLLRAADLVALNFLNEPPPPRPKKGPGAPIPIDIPMDTEEIKEIEADLDKGSYPGTDSLENAIVSFTMNNNRDFYEKYRNVSKNMQLESKDTDLIQFSKSLPLSSAVENENIPILSALVTSQARIEGEPSESSNPNVPDLTALQNNSASAVVPDISSLLSNEDGSDSSSSSANSENVSSVSSNIHQDSSLTTITETSGDNSFDISNGSFKSNENIPV